jgi:hypothetical protein
MINLENFSSNLDASQIRLMMSETLRRLIQLDQETLSLEQKDMENMLLLGADYDGHEYNVKKSRIMLERAKNIEIIEKLQKLNDSNV